MARYLYTIYGSEDGPIGVATSPKRAVEIACAYVEQDAYKAHWNACTNMKRAISQLGMRKCFHITINRGEHEYSCSAGIDKFEANYYNGL